MFRFAFLNNPIPVRDISRMMNYAAHNVAWDSPNAPYANDPNVVQMGFVSNQS